MVIQKNNLKKLPVFIALDVDDEKQALTLAEKCHPYVYGFKVGPRLYFKKPSVVQDLSQMGKVFLDFKFFDIPSTMAASVKACFEMGVDYLTVHASSGKEALTQVAQVEKDYSGKVLAVTILTSHKNEEHTDQQVLKLAKDVQESGLRGLVMSAHEVALVRKRCSEVYIVTPGIRMAENSSEDQSRVATPEYALKQGASALVIGRPVVQASDPVQVLNTISRSLGNGD